MSALDYEKISRYVDGEMTGEELEAFEQLMLRDSDLKNEVEQYKEVNETLKSKLYPGEQELALRSTIEDFQQQYFKQQTKVVPINKFRKWSAVVAAAAIIVVLLVWWPRAGDLYQQYASIKMTSTEVRGEQTDSLLQEATKNFNDKKFSEAVSQLGKLSQIQPENAYARFYYAIALLETSQIQRSREELKILYEGTSILKYDAAYYMALSYLKEKNKLSCKEWLLKIPSGADIYSKSQSLLKKL